jgi:mitochondrial fission protein ELM1
LAGSKPETGTDSRRGESAPVENPRPLTVWCFTDGKPGHENQTRGLLAALRQRTAVEAYTIHVADCRAGLAAWLTGRVGFGRELPDPDLVIGAGRATHLPMLNARRVRGGRVVVLMKPSLPTAWFDLCIIPAHDRPRRRDNILVTRGVLNRVRHDAHKDAGAGLILVGGPSAHVEWSGAVVAAQILELLARVPDMRWTLTTSRRTPAAFLAQFDAGAAQPGLDSPQLTVVPCEQAGPDWLPEQLARAAQVWVTQDSVSMVYEALTTGAAVGLLRVPWRNTRDRLARGVAQLVRDGLVTEFSAWQQGRALQPPPEPFDEAARSAAWIAERWLGAG